MVNRKAPLLTRPLFLYGPAGIWDQKTKWRRNMTGFVPVMWMVWGALVVVMLALKMYNGRLTRDEDDQLVLDSAFDRIKAEQEAIAEKVHKLEPLRKAAMWLTVAATVFVIGYYIWDIVNQFK